MEAVWLVVLATGALLVRVGQVLNAMGSARAKNAASGGFRSLADLCVATLCFWALGAAIVFQRGNSIFGIQPDQLIGWAGISGGWITMLAAMLIATGIVAPAVAERSRIAVPLAVGALLAGLIVPIVAFWVWRGWLSQMGFIDAAGAAPIHLCGALAAATAALLVGPRDGKYNRDGSSNMIPGHSVGLILMGKTLMLVGWVPYVVMLCPIEARVRVPGNLLVAAAAGGAASLVAARIRFGKPDVLLTCGGILGGLVSITAAAATVGTPAAFAIGAVAGVIVPWATVHLDLRLKLDDPGGVVAIHGIGALWALVAAAAFSPGTILDRARVLGVHALGVLVVAVLTLSLSAALLLILRSAVGLRSREADEYDGLDLAEHDLNAHPDFQQTMIKSYHLREA